MQAAFISLCCVYPFFWVRVYYRSTINRYRGETYRCLLAVPIMQYFSRIFLVGRLRESEDASCILMHTRVFNCFLREVWYWETHKQAENLAGVLEAVE